MVKIVPEGHAEREVLERLRAMGFDVQSGRQIGGYEPDMIVRLNDGRTAVIEVKSWRGDATHVDRAIAQVKLYQQALGADVSYVVMPDLDKGVPERGVLSLNDLARLPEMLATLPGAAAQPGEQRAVRFAESKNVVFAAMPFASEFDDVFIVAMTYAAESIGATCKRIDREDFSGDIVKELKSLIRQSVAVIADLSGSRPNVLYELGYAEGLTRPAVHICSSPLDKLPFDVRNWNVLEYAAGQTYKLRAPLARRLQAVLRQSKLSQE